MAKTYLQSLLAENEQIVLAARQHWFTLASAIFLEIVVILAVIILTALISIMLVPPPISTIVILVGGLVLLFPLATMIRDILDWTNRQYIVTNRRVMQISGVINKNVIDSSLEKVNDVKMEQSALGRLFGYGDIEILTASELGVNLFRRIDNPVHFKTGMLNAKARLERLDDEGLHREGLHGEGLQPITPEREDIPALIENLAQLRQRGILTEEEFQRKKAELLSKI
jgi:hypothetical protein